MELFLTKRSVEYRIPPPLFDVPSDAEYAMSLMSARVACGESVIPASRRGGRQHGRARRFIANMSMDSIPNGGDDIPKDGNWGVGKPDQGVESMKVEANEKEAVAADERATAIGNTAALKSEDTPVGPPAEVGTLERLKNQWEASKAELLGEAVSVCTARELRLAD